MKRTGNIYEKIIDKNNIYNAIISASKRKMKREKVQYVLNNIYSCVDEIHEMLKSNKYTSSPYQKMTIMDGVRKKERIIYKPQFYPDQIIHWALMLQIESVLQKGMYEFCCASIKNRGILYGTRHIKKIIVQDRKNTKYCLKLDIKKFYPSINNEILKSKFRKIIKDNETLNLIDKIIDSSEMGVPIGNYTSQWFANFYLQDFDHFIKEQLHIKFYVRYMDDMLLFNKNKKELRKQKDAIVEFLKKEKLTLKGNWQLFKVDSRPIDFIGYRFYRGYTTLRKSNFLRTKRRIKKVSKKAKLTLKDATAVTSYYGWLKHCDSYNFIRKYVEPYIDINQCKGVIKNASRKQFKTAKSIRIRKYN